MWGRGWRVCTLALVEERRLAWVWVIVLEVWRKLVSSVGEACMLVGVVCKQASAVGQVYKRAWADRKALEELA